MLLTVGDVARITGVSVRTLHHYDRIDLLDPSGRNAAHHRLYTQTDLETLHVILTWRELGLPLAEIRGLLHDPTFDRLAALRRQQALLLERSRRDQRLLSTLNVLIATAEGGTPMTREKMTELFDGFDPATHEEEAAARWGGTLEFAQASTRTRAYGAAQWQQIKQEAEGLAHAYTVLMDVGARPDSTEAQDVAWRHLEHIRRWYYDCTPSIFADLARLWVDDPRFRQNIDKHRDGLAAYQSGAALALVVTRLTPTGP
ncbi:MerR family transcriptional regulator [Deinococcus pimensis]|uniref:MerR family transcriptional regulator n=1 Tax=Deinococcus pimensis TaxID=309888 RepID=UPI0004B9D8B0|nr:MerR family transcriptional regulator [Deinococcus pimensis]